ncbi:hypothetical protein WJX73_004233 [Symbiochloris irregularis]|uniref:F-box domain-containing protein n=1 Tax=Symbiochloris irregularis TaxID=706552 RepID=A0AAW1NTE5_9CHLO
MVLETRLAKRRRYEEGAKQSWDSLPTGPLMRIFELAQALPGGCSVVRTARGVNRDWRQMAVELLLDDTASSRRPPPPPTSETVRQSRADAFAADCLRNFPNDGDRRGFNNQLPLPPGFLANIKIEGAPSAQPEKMTAFAHQAPS